MFDRRLNSILLLPSLYLLSNALDDRSESAFLYLSLEQPILDPNSWFLTKDETRDAMGGSWDRQQELEMSIWTRGNVAVPLITGETMFAQVRWCVMLRTAL